MRFFFFYNLFQEICRNIWSIFFLFVSSILLHRFYFFDLYIISSRFYFVIFLCNRRCFVNISIIFFLCFAFNINFQRCYNNKKLIFIVCHISHVNNDFKLSIRLFWKFSFASKNIYNHEIIIELFIRFRIFFVHYTIRIRDFLNEKCLFTILIVKSFNQIRFIKILIFYLHIYTLCDVQIFFHFCQSKYHFNLFFILLFYQFSIFISFTFNNLFSIVISYLLFWFVIFFVWNHRDCFHFRSISSCLFIHSIVSICCNFNFKISRVEYTKTNLFVSKYVVIYEIILFSIK